MKTLNIKDAPIKVYGIPFFEEKKEFLRIPESAVKPELFDIKPGLRHLFKRCPGARAGFRTDATEFTLKITFATFNVDIGMSIYASQSASVMIGSHTDCTHMGLCFPTDYKTKTFERTYRKSADMEDILIWLPRNEVLENVEITFPDDARVEAPTPYKYGPAVFYGSSITEGGCCTNVAHGYNALLSRWLDMDYYNFGFSGSAIGTPEVADYINTIPDMKLFVYDYDHNAPTAEHLRKTHEPFFKKIREAHPDMPIIMMTRPGFEYTPDADERIEIVRTTYENALKNGDKNVYFICGKDFFDEKDRTLCLVDCTHPNDLGFYRMAETVYPVMKKALGID